MTLGMLLIAIGGTIAFLALMTGLFMVVGALLVLIVMALYMVIFP